LAGADRQAATAIVIDDGAVIRDRSYLNFYLKISFILVFNFRGTVFLKI